MRPSIFSSSSLLLLLQEHTVKLINYATVVYFAFDMLLRCIADGVLLTPDAYLLVRVSVFTSSWLDGLCLRHAAAVHCRERAADARRLPLLVRIPPFFTSGRMSQTVSVAACC